AAVLQSEINLAACDGVIGGHCGLPFTRIIDNKLWHNPGVIGMPANDGTPRVWYSILTPGDDGLEIQHHALSYDPMVSAQKIRQQDLPAGYADCLENGHWPSLDVLPDAEREVAGQALELTKPIIFRAK
ncbi:MAG: radical SAM protein, partial [Rhodospirillaceae bacterium]|nr:radical SAM protein [Rhodospirillaceae bacterium]